MFYFDYRASMVATHANRKLKKRNAWLQSDLKCCQRTISKLNKTLANERQQKPKSEPLRGIKVSRNFQQTGSDV